MSINEKKYVTCPILCYIILYYIRVGMCVYIDICSDEINIKKNMFLNDIIMVNNCFTCSAAEKIIIIEIVNYFRIRVVLLAFSLLLLLLFWN